MVVGDVLCSSKEQLLEKMSKSIRLITPFIFDKHFTSHSKIQHFENGTVYTIIAVGVW